MAQSNSKSKKKKVQKPPKNEEGTYFVSSSGSYYVSPNIDPALIIALRDNVYATGMIDKLCNLIFQGKPTYEVKNPEGKIDEEQSNTFLQMCDSPGVRLWEKMHIAYKSRYSWGQGIFSPAWDVVEGSGKNDIRLISLGHRPSETFKSAKEGEQVTYAPILPGITLSEDGKEIEFWQEPKVDEAPVQLKNLFMYRNPSDYTLSGDAIILPMIPMFEMLKFLWNTQLQQANRVGAKILFIKVLNPQGPSDRNGNVGDLTYANSIIKNWGKNTAFVLRENMEFVDVKLTDDSKNLDIIDVLDRMCIDYILPASFLSKGQETKLGGSDTATKELIDNFISGNHRVLESQFENLLNKYFEYNQYPPGWTVDIKIPPPAHDSREQNRLDADSGYRNQSLDVNERRKLLKHEPKDEAELKELKKDFELREKSEELIGK